MASPRTGALRLEYLYSQFGKADIGFPSGTRYGSTLDFQTLSVGLNRKIDWPGSPGYDPKTSLTDPESGRWEIHGQSTFLPQGYPAFHAPYSGPNSLTPAPQLQETWSNSLLPERAALGGRRGLLQSRTAAGIRIERHGRSRRASPAARRKNQTSPTRITARRGCSCARPSALAASRKNSPAGSCNSPARSTSPG